MRLKKLEEYKKQLKFTNEQRELIVGLLLGDGHLETQNNQTYRLKVEHSIKQKTMLIGCIKIFPNGLINCQKARIKDSFGKELTSYGFTTYSSGLLRFYAQQFYFGKKKVMPKMIGKLLSPKALAIWFMDDGSWKSDRHHTYIIHSLDYSKKN